MSQITIKKGHDVRMKGIPSDEISSNISPEKVSLSPQQFRGIKPKLIVSEGDKVETSFYLVSFTHNQFWLNTSKLLRG